MTIRTVLSRYVPSIWIYASIDRRGTMMLDSSMRCGLGRESIICLLPFRTYGPDDGDSETVLNEHGRDGSIAGFITYDHGMRLHGISSKHPASDVPEFLLNDYDVMIIDDPDKRELTAVCHGRAMKDTDELELVESLLTSAEEPALPEGKGRRIVSETSRERFESSIETAREMMRNGEYYVINLSRTIRVSSETEPFDSFLRLRSISPSPFGAYMDTGDLQIVSSSMELLLNVSGGSARTRPIKGTCPRTGDPETDGRLLKGLLASEKDRSELLMITDMERNDMNSFCEPGSVRVTSFFEPETYSTVFHTVADVIGRPRAGIGYGTMLRCMFPGGSISGAPKECCLESIDELEENRRGVYTGSIGLFTEDRAVMNIAIRTMVHHDGIYTLGVGGGITFESDSAKEFDETVDKSRAMMMALGDEHGTR